ncbi:hypothetical protein M9Q43_13315 [Flavobacterium sp. HXWNR29]|uniref:hypothetical protein n=1 Tax=Flavobacterium odoriferum TaxID=2946604 RepID=UPI0021CB4653|nr:hypothetical protein [Flavobacterium sp. HXWNR29]MCU4190136.1 hypothetical protein [Flavobacterium sp. HXWNR29]
MKEYHIEKKLNKIIIKFTFDKTSTIFSGIFSIVLIFILFYNIKTNRIFDIWGYILILILILFYLTFNKYFEWQKNHTKKLEIIEDDLIINDTFYCKLNNIQTINISYNVNQFESGWTVYLNNFSKEYIIKKRLKENDAIEIANELASFLKKNVLNEN